MSYYKVKTQGCFLFLMIIVFSNSAAESVSLCGGPQAMLAVVDRPTIADSPCTVGVGHAIFEGGFQLQKQIGSGHSQQFPSMVFRVGLPKENELFAFLPNYFHQSEAPSSGLGPTGIGYKHILHYTEKWLLTFDTLVTPPSGSVNYGSQGLGGIVNAIYNYNFSDSLSFTCQLGYSSQTESELSGGHRFASLNPDAFLTWSLSDKLQLFGEVYGQSKTGVGQGSGYATQFGLVYLLAKNMTVDVEVGKRLSGLIGNFENYLGAGMAVQF
ncbi:hypothetical protein BN59_00746 [Legionella massiliensis]|uniref:Protein involved in meta-pathway of phenol degradation n=1 Tax=Legionella massiliensis TaxID=1034943 RepID=A0A078KU32_9GAMM|nr:transporter [Legionella massiliensis]CDZ76477.1 hypothetical protein BN59_00746 [Legionella massiliensis]CEE12215.1 hypothetical protein BN1094_00746 [Legionella massiliensis]